MAGSSDYGLSVFPDLRLNYRDLVFASVPDGLGWNAIRVAGLKAGPIAKIKFGRQESNGGSPFLISGSSDALAGLGDIAVAAEVGGFAQYGLMNDRIRFRGEVRRGFGGHEGTVADASVAFGDRLREFSYNIATRATFATASYTNVYFGVSPLQASRSGLPAFETKGGLVSFGLTSTLTRPVSRASAITVIANFDRLHSTVADSILIRLRGERSQLTIGIAYGLRFSWNR